MDACSCFLHVFINPIKRFRSCPFKTKTVGPHVFDNFLNICCSSFSRLLLLFFVRILKVFGVSVCFNLTIPFVVRISRIEPLKPKKELL